MKMAIVLYLLLTLAFIDTCVGFGVGMPRISSVRRTDAVKTRRTLDMRWGLKGSGPQPNVEDGVALRDTVPFELRGFSLPLVVFSVGVALTASSLAGFFLNDGDGDGALSSLGFVYGIPVFLIGLSLWYAEIPPVVVETDAAAEAKFE